MPVGYLPPFYGLKQQLDWSHFRILPKSMILQELSLTVSLVEIRVTYPGIPLYRYVNKPISFKHGNFTIGAVKLAGKLQNTL